LEKQLIDWNRSTGERMDPALPADHDRVTNADHPEKPDYMPNKPESQNGKPSRHQRAPRDLLPVIDGELRRLAAARLAREPDGSALDATALVHEAFVRLGGEHSFESRSVYFRLAAEAMRHILVDQARAKRAEKRWCEFQRLNLENPPISPADAGLLALDEALTDLDRHDPVAAELIKLRFFSGFSVVEAAKLLGLTRRQADSRWKLARAWLFRRLNS
jgi:RNA polymerase sigma factor (TIGR02999 family)